MADAHRSSTARRFRWWQVAILLFCYAVLWAHIFDWIGV